jgi:hypothetical protein
MHLLGGGAGPERVVARLPGYPTHLFIQRRIAEAGKSSPGRLGEVSRMMLDNPDLAGMGSVGPDLTFFLDLMPVAQMWLQRALKVYEAISDFVAPFNAAIDAVEDAVDAAASKAPGYEPLRDAFRDFGSTFDTLKGTLLTALAAFASGYIDAFAYLKLPMQRGEREEGWFWFDMLHYRRTSRFARALFTAAEGDPKLQAFAAGYSTHLAADVVGHSYVNSCAGAPYRTQWQRHHCSDNYLDVWTLARYEGIDVNESHWSGRYPAEMSPAIRKQFVQAMKATYTDLRHPDGRRLEGREWPSDADIARMWDMLLLAMKKQTNGYSVHEPKPPDFPLDFSTFPSPPSYTETGEGGRRRSGFSWKALFEGLLDFITKTAKYVGDVVKWIVDTAVALGVYPVRYGLYLIRLACYGIYRACRRVLSLRGYVYGHPDELVGGARISSGAAGSIAGAVLIGADDLHFDAEMTYYMPAHKLDAGYPHQEGVDASGKLLADASAILGDVSDDVKIALKACMALGGFPLSFQRPWIYPDAPVEAARTVSGPYDNGSLPDAFIEKGVFSPAYYEAFKKVDSVAKMLALSAAAGGGAAAMAGLPFGGPVSFGNAVDLGKAMLKDIATDGSAPDFNLDGDRGYGWLCWDVAPLGAPTRKTGDFTVGEIIIGDDVGKMTGKKPPVLMKPLKPIILPGLETIKP